MNGALDPVFVLSNRIEAAVWGAIALIMVIAAVVRPGNRRACLVAALAFATFGASDIVETRTGAWWRPWWLLVWKGACVLTLLWLLNGYMKRRAARVTAAPQTPADESATRPR